MKFSKIIYSVCVLGSVLSVSAYSDEGTGRVMVGTDPSIQTPRGLQETDPVTDSTLPSNELGATDKDSKLKSPDLTPKTKSVSPDSSWSKAAGSSKGWNPF